MRRDVGVSCYVSFFVPVVVFWVVDVFFFCSCSLGVDETIWFKNIVFASFLRFIYSSFVAFENKQEEKTYISGTSNRQSLLLIPNA